MTVRLIPYSTGLAASVALGVLLLAVAGHSHAAPLGDAAGIKPVGVIVHAVQSKGDRGTLFRPPQNIKPPPGPNVRDHRGGKQTSPSTAQGGVTVTSQPRRPRCRPGFLHACLADPKGRDHRSK